MICQNCKTEVENGLIHCPICGKPFQLVADYNLLEDDVLPAFLDEEKEALQKRQGRQKRLMNVKREDIIFQKKLWIVAGFFALFIALAVIFFIYRYRSSYSFQFVKGEEAELAGAYASAAEHYKKAVDQEPQNDEALLAVGRVELAIGNMKEAEEYLLLAVDANPKREETFSLLLSIYERQKNYDAMEELYFKAKTKETRNIFAEYLILPPLFSVSGGTYSDDFKLELTSEDGYDIYYTLNGKDPTGKSRKRYKKPIRITGGKTQVSAVCRTNSGKFGRKTQVYYQVVYQPPGYPKVVPEGGRFDEAQSITITSEAEGARIYYTWDESEPTEESREYTSPISMPEGNNILSVIVVDEHGLKSEVLECNYTYIPKTEPEPEEEEEPDDEGDEEEVEDVVIVTQED